MASGINLEWDVLPHEVRRDIVHALDAKTKAHTDLLAKVAREDDQRDVRQAAVRRLDPQVHGEVLARVAVEDKAWDVRHAAVKRLDPALHGELLTELAQNDTAEDVRMVAQKRLDEAKAKSQAEESPAPGM